MRCRSAGSSQVELFIHFLVDFCLFYCKTGRHGRLTVESVVIQVRWIFPLKKKKYKRPPKDQVISLRTPITYESRAERSRTRPKGSSWVLQCGGELDAHCRIFGGQQSACLATHIESSGPNSTQIGATKHAADGMSCLELTQTLAESFNALANEVQNLIDRKTILEHKLRYAHEQVSKSGFRPSVTNQNPRSQTRHILCVLALRDDFLALDLELAFMPANAD